MILLLQQIPNMSNFDRKTTQKPIFLNFLRQFNRQHKSQLSKSASNIRHKKHLRKMLEENTNIFHLTDTKNFSRKFVQKVIWQKNYSLKIKINILKEQNSSLKAKLWNIEKENRRMQKQMDTWNLTDIFTSTQNKKKPYIDTITVLKVLDDQDYKIVSMKIEIAKLQNQLLQKQDQIAQLINNQEALQKYDAHMSYLLNQQKQLLCEVLIENNQLNNSNLQSIKVKQQNKVNEIQCAKEVHRKNIELKRKTNLHIGQDLENILREQALTGQKTNEEDIDRLKLEIRKLKLEERDQLKQMHRQVEKVRRQRQEYECNLQEKMGKYIEMKICLSNKIAGLCEKIKQQLGDKLEKEQFKQLFQPQIAQFL